MDPRLVVLAACAALPSAQEVPPLPPDEDTPVAEELRRRDLPREALEADGAGPFEGLVDRWARLRERLEQAGLAVELLLTADGSLAIDGLDGSRDALRMLLEGALTWDVEHLLGIAGGTLFVGLEWIAGGDASVRYGVLQAVSNIDAGRRQQVARAWYEQVVADGTRLRLGKIDANSLFAWVESGSRFLNGSMGFSPAILPLPSYPDPAFGAVLVQAVGPRLELCAGVFDGSGLTGTRTGSLGPAPLLDGDGGLLWIGELDLAWEGAHAGRAGLGGWRFAGDAPRLDGGEEDGTSGVYGTLDARLWSESAAAERHVAGFLQWGLADGDVAPIESHLGVGLVWSDAFPSLAGDRVGLAVSRAGLSTEPGAGFTADHETLVELFCGFEAAPWVRVRTDLQVFSNPGGGSDREELVVGTLRLTFAL